MDPNATLAMALDVTSTRAERKEAANNLRAWLAGGGFAPNVFRIFTATRCHVSADGSDRVLCGTDVSSPAMGTVAVRRCARCATVLAAAGAIRLRWI